MSRYAWPAPRKKQHSGALRLRWDIRTSGVMREHAVASARIANMESAPAGDANLWVPIGPSTVTNSGITSNPRVTGRTRDIAVSLDGTRVYAATAGGGVWHSSDAGT